MARVAGKKTLNRSQYLFPDTTMAHISIALESFNASRDPKSPSVVNDRYVAGGC